MSFPLGAHVDSVNPLADAAALGAGVVQIFLGDPQSWKKPAALTEGGAEALRLAAAEAGVQLVVHSPYALNVASLNNRVRIPSRKLLQQTVDEAAAVGALGVVVHGGHVTAKDDPAVGYENWRKCVDGLKLPVPIFIENTAGGGQAMARYEESIERLWDAISGSDNIGQVGFCLDTCHAHAGGLELDGLVGRIKAITGRIDVVHCNDSRDAYDSGADRHANLGQGQADPEALIAIIREAAVPTILETPGGVPEHDADLAWLRARL
ncbi:deoxyribonuclease IV [Tessaracoccus sp. MC1865]|uniref:deoxyribonuclease IV n=1 Tax=Tessaracoccus sp. MC1865 TaxID=2760310 RepID=UPI00160001A7|nr:deoxyribonuclease IV [Tessaracoccus sp. MC1865]MBB1483227.1 deoxyribonuclease IV [Tessaracoccus sp. MC1865]QTO37358.1 deoxyribonuclease IV [Tessaracoccus sp. MC1865]